jgi:hypothetical protein
MPGSPPVGTPWDFRFVEPGHQSDRLDTVFPNLAVTTPRYAERSKPQTADQKNRQQCKNSEGSVYIPVAMRHYVEERTALAAAAATLAQGVMQSMFWNKIKIGVLALLLTIVTSGVGDWAVYVLAGSSGAHDPASPGNIQDPDQLKQKELTRAQPQEPVVREIDLKGFHTEHPKNDFAKPTKINTQAELAKIIPDKGWQSKIAKRVDFGKEYLLFFAWSGSSEDWLSFRLIDPATVKKNTAEAILKATEAILEVYEERLKSYRIERRRVISKEE